MWPLSSGPSHGPLIPDGEHFLSFCGQLRVGNLAEFRGKFWACDNGVGRRWGLEAQQRYFAYRAILVAIVSQNSIVLVFVRYHTIIARYVAKWGIAQVCLSETK